MLLPPARLLLRAAPATADCKLAAAARQGRGQVHAAAQQTHPLLANFKLQLADQRVLQPTVAQRHITILWVLRAVGAGAGAPRRGCEPPRPPAGSQRAVGGGRRWPAAAAAGGGWRRAGDVLEGRLHRGRAHSAAGAAGEAGRGGSGAGASESAGLVSGQAPGCEDTLHTAAGGCLSVFCCRPTQLVQIERASALREPPGHDRAAHNIWATLRLLVQPSPLWAPSSSQTCGVASRAAHARVSRKVGIPQEQRGSLGQAQGLMWRPSSGAAPLRPPRLFHWKPAASTMR